MLIETYSIVHATLKTKISVEVQKFSGEIF